VIFPVDERTFLGQDLHLLESMEFNQRVKPVQEIIEGIEWQDVDPDLLTRSLDSCFNCFFLFAKPKLQTEFFWSYAFSCQHFSS